jgi:hypothetical protein
LRSDLANWASALLQLLGPLVLSEQAVGAAYLSLRK